MLVFAHIHQVVILARPVIAGLEVQHHPFGSTPFQLKLLLFRNPKGCESYVRAVLFGLLSTVQAACNQCAQFSCQRRSSARSLRSTVSCSVSGEDEPADKEELRKAWIESARRVGLAFRISSSTTLESTSLKRIGTCAMQAMCTEAQTSIDAC